MCDRVRISLGFGFSGLVLRNGWLGARELIGSAHHDLLKTTGLLHNLLKFAELVKRWWNLVALGRI